MEFQLILNINIHVAIDSNMFNHDNVVPSNIHVNSVNMLRNLNEHTGLCT